MLMLGPEISNVKMIPLPEKCNSIFKLGPEISNSIFKLDPEISNSMFKLGPEIFNYLYIKTGP